MSFYTKFQDAEPTVTSTSTSILLSSDPILVYSANQKHAAQSVVGAIAAQEAVTFATTTQSTTTFVSNYGITIFQSTGGSSAVWVLADPTSVGLSKTLVLGTTTTSTLYSIVPQSATIGSTAAAGGSLVNLASTATGSNQANAVTLTAQTTSLWLVTGKNGTAIYS